jgi:hypothetical protein
MTCLCPLAHGENDMAGPAPSPLTSDVRLRDVAEGDLLIFFDHQLDPDATQMAAFPARDSHAFMAHWTKILADETITKKTIIFDGQVAGNIVCWEQFGERQSATGLESTTGAMASPPRRWQRFWVMYRRAPCMPMSRNIISPRSGSWKNVGSRFRARTRRFPTYPARRSKKLF